jgi:hypothetical protein
MGRAAAIVGGVALTGIEVYGAVGYLVSQGQPNYLVAGGAVVTIAAAALPVLAGRCWRSRRYILAALLWAAMVPALSVIVCAAVERTGSANDNAERGRQAVAQKLALAREAEKEAKAVAAEDEAAAKAECASGRKAKCLGLEARADLSRQRLEAARGGVAQAGIAPRDPMASRLAAVLPVNEEAVRIYQPLILPLVISALGLLLIAAGAHGEVVDAEVPEPLPEADPRAKVISWVREYKRRHGRSPKIPEVQNAFGLKRSTAYRRIEQARR